LYFYFAIDFFVSTLTSLAHSCRALPLNYFPNSSSTERYLPDHGKKSQFCCFGLDLIFFFFFATDLNVHFVAKFLSVSPSNFIFLSSVKKAQRSDAIIVRLYNPTDFGSRTLLKVNLFLGRFVLVLPCDTYLHR
jgi:hypothetical protein